ncbi:hypothetical protein GBA52_025255 [Prunus armeniaca]|nr:hypothetical protein GBA52_025255 [Prunus armeniaca]
MELDFVHQILLALPDLGLNVSVAVFESLAMSFGMRPLAGWPLALEKPCRLKPIKALDWDTRVSLIFLTEAN